MSTIFSKLINLAGNITGILPGANVQTVTATNAGVLSTGADTIAGSKTFTGVLTLTTQPAMASSDVATRTIRNATSDGGSVLIFGSPIFDIGSNFNGSTGVYTVPITGVYLVSISVAYIYTANATTTAGVILMIRKNGSEVTEIINDGLSPLGRFGITQVSLIQATASDTIDTFLQTNIGGSSTRTLTTNHAEISISKIY